MESRKARYERRQRARAIRNRESIRARRRNLYTMLMFGVAVVAIIAVVIGGLALFVSTRKTLPPTGFGPAHEETFPPQRVMGRPIPRPVQEHIMEHGHGPGSNYPGILVQYNCVQFDCESDLVSQLEDIVREYPTYTYLAPYPTMDAKIALTTRGKLDVLEELDETRIVQFIERNQGQ